MFWPQKTGSVSHVKIVAAPGNNFGVAGLQIDEKYKYPGFNYLATVTTQFTSNYQKPFTTEKQKLIVIPEQQKE